MASREEREAAAAQQQRRQQSQSLPRSAAQHSRMLSRRSSIASVMHGDGSASAQRASKQAATASVRRMLAEGVDRHKQQRQYVHVQRAMTGSTGAAESTSGTSAHLDTTANYMHDTITMSMGRRGSCSSSALTTGGDGTRLNNTRSVSRTRSRFASFFRGARTAAANNSNASTPRAAGAGDNQAHATGASATSRYVSRRNSTYNSGAGVGGSSALLSRSRRASVAYHVNATTADAPSHLQAVQVAVNLDEDIDVDSEEDEDAAMAAARRRFGRSGATAPTSPAASSAADGAGTRRGGGNNNSSEAAVRVWTVQQFMHNMARAILQHNAPRLRKLLRLYQQLAKDVQQQQQRGYNVATTAAGDGDDENNNAPSPLRRTHPHTLLVDDYTGSAAAAAAALYGEVDDCNNNNSNKDGEEDDEGLASKRSSILDYVLDPNTGYTLMHLAVLSQDKDIVYTCLRHGSKVHAVQDVQGETPLTLAMRRYPGVVSALFAVGRNVNVNRPVIAHGGTRATSPGALASMDAHARLLYSPASPATLTTGAGGGGGAVVSFPSSANPLLHTGSLGNTSPANKLVFVPSARSGNNNNNNKATDAAAQQYSYTNALHQNLLHCAVTADELTPPWPGRLAFMMMLIKNYHVSVTQEDVYGFTPVLWAREHARYLGKRATNDIVRCLKKAERAQRVELPEEAMLHMVGCVPRSTTAMTSSSASLAATGVGRQQGQRRGGGGGAASGAAAVAAATAMTPRSASTQPSPHTLSPASAAAAAAKTSPRSHSANAAAAAATVTTVPPTASAHMPYSKRRSSLHKLVDTLRHTTTTAAAGGASSSSAAAAGGGSAPLTLQQQQQQELARRRARSPFVRDALAADSLLAARATAGTAAGGAAGAAGVIPRMPLYTTAADRVRRALQGHVARLLVLLLLLPLHCAAYALSVDVDAYGYVRFDLIFTDVNLLASCWTSSPFFLGLAHALCLLLGGLVGVVVVYYLACQLVAARVLRLPSFGAQSDAERALLRQQFGAHYVVQYKPLRRSRLFAVPVGVLVGVYVGAAVYNALLRLLWPSQAYWATMHPYMGDGDAAALSPLAQLRLLWALTLALDWYAVCFAADVMYQQGALAIYLPHYTFDRFANWVDAHLYTVLLRSGMLCLAQVYIRPPCTRRRGRAKARGGGGGEANNDDDDDEDDGSSSSDSEDDEAEDGGGSDSDVDDKMLNGRLTRATLLQRRRQRQQRAEARRRRRQSCARMRAGVSIEHFRLWAFWSVLLLGWVCIAVPFVVVGVLQHAPHAAAAARGSNNDGSNASASFRFVSVSRACLCVLFSSVNVLLLCVAALQEWSWPTLQLHELLSLPGCGLCAHHAWAYMLLLWCIGTLDVRNLVEHARTIVAMASASPAALSTTTTAAAAAAAAGADAAAGAGDGVESMNNVSAYYSGAVVGMSFATLPAVLGVLLLIIFVAATSLWCATTRTHAHDEGGKNNRDATRNAATTTTKTRVTAAGEAMSAAALAVPDYDGRRLHTLVRLWRQWMYGPHMFALPVPGVFGVVRYLYPALPQWRALELGVMATPTMQQQQQQQQQQQGVNGGNSSSSNSDSLHKMTSHEVAAHDAEARAVAAIELLRFVAKLRRTPRRSNNNNNNNNNSNDKKKGRKQRKDADVSLSSLSMDELSPDGGGAAVAAPLPSSTQTKTTTTAQGGDGDDDDKQAVRAQLLRSVLRRRLRQRRVKASESRARTLAGVGGSVKVRRRRYAVRRREHVYTTAFAPDKNKEDDMAGGITELQRLV